MRGAVGDCGAIQLEVSVAFELGGRLKRDHVLAVVSGVAQRAVAPVLVARLVRADSAVLAWLVGEADVRHDIAVTSGVSCTAWRLRDVAGAFDFAARLRKV